MPATYNQSTPNMILNEEGNVVAVHHNHYSYKPTFNDFKPDQERRSIKACIAFFKSVERNPQSSPLMQASASSAVKEDEQRLKDLNSSACVLL